MFKIPFCFVFLFATLYAAAQDINIIPKPVLLVEKSGSFIITKNTPLVAKTKDEIKSANFLNDYIKSCYGFSLPLKISGNKGIIITAANRTGKDGYTLNVNTSSVSISGNTAPGAFYGMQTLIQLLPLEKSNNLRVPAVLIKDEPVAGYRGLMLDVSRHFFPVSFVKRYIDYIAFHKMNSFHWHLTDDQGWRIEIKKYPELTSVGAWRNGTIVGRFPGSGSTNERYGGFYTQEQVKEIVKYAADRFITVIPEIEMPGHGSAAIAAYPYLSCFPEKPTYDYFKRDNIATNWAGDTTKKEVMQSWGVYADVFCAGKETTFEFLQNVLNEVIPLFPSKIIHVGGDECPKSNWEECPLCQKRIKDLGIKGDSTNKPEHYLQSYFVQRIEKFLNAKGKTLIGWDEILEGGLAPNAWVMSWRGEKGGIEAAKQKHNVIMTPTTYAYIDYQQVLKDDSITITNNNGGFLSVDKVYSWKLFPDELTINEKPFIKGGQANLWTEYIDNPSKVEYMIFPRVDAVSEVLWTPESKKNWEDFSRRLDAQKKRYNLWNVNYFGRKN